MNHLKWHDAVTKRNLNPKERERESKNRRERGEVGGGSHVLQYLHITSQNAPDSQWNSELLGGCCVFGCVTMLLRLRSCCVSLQCHVICRCVVFSSACLCWCIAFKLLGWFYRIMTGPRSVFMLMVMWVWETSLLLVLHCDRTNRSIALAPSVSEVLQKKKLGQSDLLWEHHPFFICWSLNFCHVLTA